MNIAAGKGITSGTMFIGFEQELRVDRGCDRFNEDASASDWVHCLQRKHMHTCVEIYICSPAAGVVAVLSSGWHCVRIEFQRHSLSDTE